MPIDLDADPTCPPNWIGELQQVLWCLKFAPRKAPGVQDTISQLIRDRKLTRNDVLEDGNVLFEIGCKYWCAHAQSRRTHARIRVRANSVDATREPSANR